MRKGDYLKTILRSEKTVFSFKDIVLLWQTEATTATRVRLNYYVKMGELIRIRKGLYAKDKNYDRIELASRIFTPSYVSFETVLAKEGLIFQYYSYITVASYITRKLNIDNQEYSFKKIKNPILLNSIGVTNKNGVSIASKERAFLDTLYIYNNYHFDNLRSLNWDKVFQILKIFNNRRMEKIVNSLYITNKSL